MVTFIEFDRGTARLIAQNAKTLGFGKADVVTGSVPIVLGSPPAAPYDVVFMDPPYPLDEVTVSADLELLDAQRWLVPGAMVVVERSSP